jgi:hypothetical protein
MRSEPKEKIMGDPENEVKKDETASEVPPVEKEVEPPQEEKEEPGEGN